MSEEMCTYFCVRETDRHIDERKNKQMDSIDASRRLRYRERRLNKHPGRGGSSLRPGYVRGGSPRGAGAEIKNSASWKFCPTTHRIYVSSFIDVGPAIS